MKILCINCNADFSWFTTRGLKIEVTRTIDVMASFKLKFLYKVQNSDRNFVDLYTPDVEGYLKTNYSKKEYDVIMVGWSPSRYGEEVKNTGGYTAPVKLPNGAYWITVRQDAVPVNMYPVHEMMHAICIIINIDFGDHVPKDFMDQTPVNGVWMPYYKNDYNITDADSNFNQTWRNIIPFLDKLNSLNSKPMNTYKYFKDSEIVGLKPELVAMLDKARGIAGVPFIITSGFRTPAQNIKVGGVSDSSHEFGMAVDLLIKDSISGGKIMLALVQSGFTRFGFYKDGHIHVDIDKSKANPCYWIE